MSQGCRGSGSIPGWLMAGAGWLVLATATATATATANAADGNRSAPVAEVREGTLQGARKGAVDVFLGVPFAQPPVGSLRWRAPQAVASWDGVRPAAEFGASCYQQWPARPFGPYTAEYVDTPPHSEDCLYLNVWTPAQRQDRLPVLVWIHGGGFGGGSGAVPIYDGAKLAAQGVVVVTINYRVGPFGFLAHPELSRESAGSGTGNYGLLDMIAALHWVQRNAAAFGGDPGRVSVAGQSAGAVAVKDLLVSPAARGLFARAIAQSAPPIDAIPRQKAESNGLEFAKQVGVSTVAGLRGLPPERIQAAIPSYFDPPRPGAPPRIEFRPVLDGVVVPHDPLDGGAPSVSNVPLLIGFSADEFMPAGQTSAADFERSLRSRYGAAAERFLELYPHANDDEATASARIHARDLYMASMYLWADERTRSSGQRIHAYLFEHPAPVASGPGFGTFHSSEIPYVFGVLDRTRRPFTAADERIAAQLQGYWLNFVRHGDPNGPGLAEWSVFVPGTEAVMGLGDLIGPRAPVSSPERLAAFAGYLDSGGRLLLR